VLRQQTSRNYAATIDFLMQRLPMFSRIGVAAYRKDLRNIIRLCEFLGQPQQRFRSVHIAGTNGKGSVSHMLAAILQTAGYRTGLYTSPHLSDFRERIRVNGTEVRPEFVVTFTDRIRPMIDELDPSFFEISVAMAFEYFASENVEIAVIETGLGGRLDSTNIVDPELTVVTNIGWDHMNLLGNTLEQIAAEKAGIIKPGVPIVIGEESAETLQVFEMVAKEKNAPLTVASRQRTPVDWSWKRHHLIVELASRNHEEHDKFELDLSGIYQAKNLVTSLEAVTQLRNRGWKIDPETVKKALRQVRRLTGLHGRWDVIREHPLVVLDVAHNVDGIQQLLRQIEVTPHSELHLVIGMVKDKEVSKILGLLPRSAHYYFTRAQIPRALPETELASMAKQAGIRGSAWPEVNRALAAALANSGRNDLVLVFGSVFLAGEVNRVWNN